MAKLTIRLGPNANTDPMEIGSREVPLYVQSVSDRAAISPHELTGLLSKRESQILEMVAQGLTNVEVSSHLDVTVHAVKFHLASIYRKLGVGNRTEAAVTLLMSRQTNGSADPSTEARPRGA